MLDLSRIAAHHKVRLSNPLVASCPRCAVVATRHETRVRYFWEADLRMPTIIEVHGGCYLCDRCPPGYRWFCMLPPELRTSRQYACTAVRFVVNLVKTYKMPAEAAAALARDQLHLSRLDSGGGWAHLVSVSAARAGASTGHSLGWPRTADALPTYPFSWVAS